MASSCSLCSSEIRLLCLNENIHLVSDDLWSSQQNFRPSSSSPAWRTPSKPPASRRRACQTAQSPRQLQSGTDNHTLTPNPAAPGKHPDRVKHIQYRDHHKATDTCNYAVQHLPWKIDYHHAALKPSSRISLQIESHSGHVRTLKVNQWQRKRPKQLSDSSKQQ